VTYLKMRISLL